MKNTIPDFSQIPRDKVPRKYQWDLKDIFPDLKEWQKGRDAFKKNLDQLGRRAEGWTDSARKMDIFLTWLSAQLLLGDKLYVYCTLQNDCDMNNKLYQKMKGEIKTLLVELKARLAFFDQDILKLGEERFSAFLTERKALGRWDFKIGEIFRMRRHTLTEELQKIVTLTGLYSHTFGDASEVLNNIDIPFKKVTLSDGKRVELNYQALVRHRRSAEAKDRTKVMKLFFTNQKKFENTFALLINGEINKHLFFKKVHKYDSCLLGRLYPEDIDSQVYHNLIRQVKVNLAPLHNYLKIKKELMELKTLKYEDLYAPSIRTSEKQYRFAEARELVKSSLLPLGSGYQAILQKAFTDGWIDLYPNQGKQSGAYCNHVYGIHPYIKLNYDGSYNSVSTLTHELGHALHSFLSSQNQPYEKADYSIFTAEIASTFNEILLLEHLLKVEKNDLVKITLIDRFMEQVRGTIYRQTLFAEYELNMHEKVEQGQTLTADWLNTIYLDLTRRYYGHDRGIVRVDSYIESEWSVIPHFYYNFYVYTYSTGIIAAMALSENLLSDRNPSAARSYLALLKEGGSRSPLEILKTAGVDMNSDDPYRFAFIKLKRLVKQMRELQLGLTDQKRI